jgi:hypothetical protein
MVSDGGDSVGGRWGPDGAWQLQGGKGNNKVIVIRRERRLEETLTGKGKMAVVLDGSLPENLWVAQACGCGGWPLLPTDGELRRRSLAVAQGGSGRGRRWFKLKGKRNRFSGDV